MGRYAISDLHGHLDLYKNVKALLKEGDILYVLGDCNDRGPQPWETLKVVLQDPQCILILGNHELMLRDYMHEFFMKGKEYNQYLRLLDINGGMQTVSQWLNETNRFEWYNKLCILPSVITLEREEGKLILTHAGYTPGKEMSELEDFVWDRYHFTDDWPQDNNDIIIHGHTPNMYMLNYLKWGGKGYNFEDLDEDLKKIVYADGHKICIDPGSVLTQKTILINLDTLEQTVVKGDFWEDEDNAE